MKLAKYLGADARIGRFGIVKHGQAVELNEAEFRSIEGSPDWKRIKTPDVPRLGVLPCHGDRGSYDLTTVPWNTGKLYPFLRRKQRATLRKIADQLNALGASIPSSGTVQKSELEDSIAEFAKDEGWTEMDDYVLQGLQGEAQPLPA